MSSYIDITPKVSERIGVYPGDVPYSREIALDFKKGDHLVLSSIQTTVHVGAHTDAPNHYSRDGVGIDQRDLTYYMGPCLVLNAAGTPRGERVRREFLSEKWQHAQTWPAPRILVRTDSFLNREEWRSDYCSLDPSLIEEWARAGVRLVGIDTPSIDPDDSKDLPSHAMVARHDLAILEGVDLSQVEEGLYTLIALPLRLEDADASPVRAILLKDLEVLKA